MNVNYCFSFEYTKHPAFPQKIRSVWNDIFLHHSRHFLSTHFTVTNTHTQTQNKNTRFSPPWSQPTTIIGGFWDCFLYIFLMFWRCSIYIFFSCYNIFTIIYYYFFFLDLFGATATAAITVKLLKEGHGWDTPQSDIIIIIIICNLKRSPRKTSTEHRTVQISRCCKIKSSKCLGEVTITYAYFADCVELQLDV